MSSNHLKNEAFNLMILLSEDQKGKIDQIYKTTCQEIFNEFPLDYTKNGNPNTLDLETIDKNLDNVIGMLSSSSTNYNLIASNSSVKFWEVGNFIEKHLN